MARSAQHHDTDTDTSFSYEDMLRTSMAEVREPSRLAGGQWTLRCTGAKMTKNESDTDDGAIGTILLTHVPVKPGDNVDTEAVEGGEWRGKRIFTRFNIRDRSDLFQVKNILIGHGISEDHTLEEMMALVKGKLVEATAGLRTFKRRDGSTAIENSLSNFTPV